MGNKKKTMMVTVDTDLEGILPKEAHTFNAHLEPHPDLALGKC